MSRIDALGLHGTTVVRSAWSDHAERRIESAAERAERVSARRADRALETLEKKRAKKRGPEKKFKKRK